MSVTLAFAATALVDTLKLALLPPAATVTLAGTVATAGLLLDSVTTAPPEGTAAVKVAVPVAAAGPTTLAGLTDTADKLAADGIEPERPPYTVREGGSRLCFVRDPDDYRIELIERDPGA